MKYRAGPDGPAPMKKKMPTPGRIQDEKLGVYKGDYLVGQVGRLATAATARRFGAVAAKLSKKNGAPAWCGK